MITRTIPFRDVLWGVAYKFGLDPEQSNFLTNQAIPIGRSIDEWVQRLWASVDFPEWAETHSFVPDTNHIVTWDQQFTFSHVGEVIPKIGRVLGVFLVDPTTTDSPVDTPWTEQTEGVHVGFEHGTSVWIQYLPPPPRFSAVQWRGDIIYAKGDVVYSNRTGECYTSKSAGNVGHDPSFSFSPPTSSPPNVPPPSVVPPPAVDTPQQRTPDNPGLVERNQIYIIDFDKFKPSYPGGTTQFHIPDPPLLNDQFYIDIFDEDGTLLGEGGPINANGVDTLSAIMSALAADLDANLGGTFVVTSGAKSVTVENNSVFYTGHAFYLQNPPGYPHYFPNATVSQSYIPATTGAAGSPQITVVTIMDEQVITGATYWIVFTDSNGITHPVQYVAQEGDSMAQILAALNTAIEEARNDDAYFNTVSPSVNPSDSTLTLSITDVASVNTTLVVPGSPWWEINLFAHTLANPVMRGAIADLLAEWAQHDKSAAQEQMVPLEQEMAINRFSNRETPLTDQDSARSRYKV